MRTRLSTTRSCASSVDPENSPDGDCRLKKRRLCFRIAGSEPHGLPTILLEDNVDLAVAATLLPGVLRIRELAIEARATVVSRRGRSPSAPTHGSDVVFFPSASTAVISSYCLWAGAEPLCGNAPSYFPFLLTDWNLIPKFMAF